MPDTQKDQTQPTWNPDNVFAGTAWYYARYRPGYPDKVFDLLRDRFGLTGDSRVLDLGCGTGQIALQLAPYVFDVIAVDPQEEMLQEGRSAAVSHGISNINWLKGESSRLFSMTKQIVNINLTVIARAFHWMDREHTLKDLFKITVPGGGVAVIFDSGPTNGELLPWKKIIQQTVKKWLGEERRAGTEGTYSHPQKRFEAYLKESEFSKYEEASYAVERSWSLDEIIGYLYSTSFASLPVLGDKKERFEADLIKRLLKLEPSGRYHETVTIEIKMGWKQDG
jgi:ubiquinone/menaquinone biosynthesis C-methylase UbiE